MVPARRTGKPFWDIYVYQDPPLWKAYIDACKYYDIDGGFELYQFGDLFGDLDEEWIDRIVDRRADGSFVTQGYCPQTGEWSQYVRVHTADNPPATKHVGRDRGRARVADRHGAMEANPARDG